jgi:tetratricopeptide (TPR) repeat protein
MMTKHSTLRVLFGPGFVALFLISCTGGGSTSISDDAPPVGVEEIPRDDNIIRAEVTRPGHVVLRGPVSNLEAGMLVELVPDGPWPFDEASRPSQAVLLVTSVDDDVAEVLTLGQRTRALELEGLRMRELSALRLPISKVIGTVTRRTEQTVQLNLGAGDGVMPGDYFFALGEPESESDRVGSRIIALLRVIEPAPGGSEARIVHEMTPVETDSIVIFAHNASPTSEQPEALILFARTQEDVPHDGFALPALANAVVEYQFDFQFSNIRIETLDVYIDPALYDAPEQAQALAPEDGFGVIVFGNEREDDFLYNITTFGSPPSPNTTVAILAGGLPLPTPDGLDALSPQLAPSFLATALTQRGGHAESIYFLEYCLRNRDISEPVAFHLREHLALRYESIGQVDEGMRLMDHDIERARDIDNPYAELNALSIREYLNRTRGDVAAELDDLETFLERADSVLPDEALLGERLEWGRILARLTRYGEAMEVFDDVLAQARLQGSVEWELSANIARASGLFQRGDVNGAIATANDALSTARLVGESYPRHLHSLLAQYYSELSQYTESMANLQAAMLYATEDGSPYWLASTHELAGNLRYVFDDIYPAISDMTHAARMYRELDRQEDLARSLRQVAMLEILAFERARDPLVLNQAHEHFVEAAETYFALGDGLSAAELFGFAGQIGLSLDSPAQALRALDISALLGQAYYDPITVALALERTAEFRYHLGDIGRASESLQLARAWAVAFDLHQVLEVIERLSETIRNEI